MSTYLRWCEKHPYLGLVVSYSVAIGLFVIATMIAQRVL